jgi:hypothetical protein
MKFAGFAEVRFGLDVHAVCVELRVPGRYRPGLAARLIADLHQYSIPFCGDDDVDICLCFSALRQTAFVKI